MIFFYQPVRSKSKNYRNPVYISVPTSSVGAKMLWWAWKDRRCLASIVQIWMIFLISPGASRHVILQWRLWTSCTNYLHMIRRRTKKCTSRTYLSYSRDERSWVSGIRTSPQYLFNKGRQPDNTGRVLLVKCLLGRKRKTIVSPWSKRSNGSNRHYPLPRSWIRPLSKTSGVTNRREGRMGSHAEDLKIVF